MSAADATAPVLTERKVVSVMFIDMVGSLDAIRDKDPEDAHELLTAAMQLMTRAVHDFGGVVAETRGDGVLAIFGAPAAQEDHAARACHAALRLQWLVTHEIANRVALRVGINSGEVAVGSVPNDFTRDYTATGAVVHIAARVQAVAEPDSAVMTAQTAALVRGVMLTEPIGAASIKGLEQPLELHRLVGMTAVDQGRLPRAKRDFVGRAIELGQLDHALRRALGGQGSVLGISGEAGIGKTALIERFVHRHRNAVQAVRCAAEYHTSVAPLRPFALIVEQLLDLGKAPPAERRARLIARLALLDLDRRRCEAPLLDLLDLLELGDLPSHWRTLAPLLRHDLIATAIVQLLLAHARGCGLVVVLEDLQRADSATVELVDRLAESIDGHRLLVIVAFRPELNQLWGRNPCYRELHLRRLGDDETASLAARLLGGVSPPRLWQRLLAWSKGNPLFLRESIRAAVEAGALNDPDADIAVPPSISAVIAARIDRLAPTAKRVLLAASVLGKTFSQDVLADLCEASEDVTTFQLGVLEAADFVRAVEPGGLAYGFEHGLYQETCYATLLRRQRRELHRAAFAALSRTGRAAAPPAVEQLAHHAHGGELWTQAVVLCRDAAQRAASGYANREAALHLEHAIAALEMADPHAGRLEEAIALRLELRSALIPLLRLDRIDALLTEAGELAQRLGDDSLSARISAYRAGHAYLTRSSQQCLDLCGNALRLASQTRDSRLTIAPILYAAQARYGLGQYRRVVADLDREPLLGDAGVAGAEVGLPVRPWFMRGYWLSIAHAELGRFATARVLADEMLGLADDRQPFEALYALTAQGFVLMLEGDGEAGLRSSLAALAIAERHDIAFIVPVLASQAGFLLAAQGQAADGCAMARRAVRKAEELGIQAGRSRWSARLSETCLRAGATDDAVQYAETAVAVAEHGAELGYLCSALRLRAKTRACGGDLDGARGDLQRAVAVARKLRLGPALAKCHFDTGALALCAARPAEAQSAFERAGKLFSLYRMAAAVERAERGLARLDGAMSSLAAQDFFGSAE